MDKQIIIKDLLISYSETQGDGGRTLLFLHGWRSSAQVWQGIIERFKDSTHSTSSGQAIERLTIYALDLPGFGGSQMIKNPHSSFDASGHLLPGGEGGNSVADYADVVADFIKKLDLKNVIVVGHSFGGRVGIKLASNYPSLITKLVLVDSAGFAMTSSRKNFYRSMAKIVKPIFKPQFMQGLRKKIYQKIGAEDYVATPELQKTFVNITSEDLSADMKNIKCPTLIINGEKDHDTPFEFGNRMYALIPKSRFVILKNAGHFSFLDQTKEFTAVLHRFITDDPTNKFYNGFR